MAHHRALASIGFASYWFIAFPLVWVGFTHIFTVAVQSRAIAGAPTDSQLILPPTIGELFGYALVPTGVLLGVVLGVLFNRLAAVDSDWLAAGWIKVAIPVSVLLLLGTAVQGIAAVGYMTDREIAWRELLSGSDHHYAWGQVTGVELQTREFHVANRGSGVDEFLWVDFDDGERLNLWHYNPTFDLTGEQTILEAATLLRLHHVPVRSIDQPSRLMSESEQQFFERIAETLQPQGP